MKKLRDITLLIAHPDDEILWAWPVLDRVQRIVCVASDAHNRERAWCAARGTCLHEVGRRLQCGVKLLDYDSEFYRLETRPIPKLKYMAGEVLAALEESQIIYTHNPWGEYGNVDHILCHQLARMAGVPVLTSDMAMEVNWLPVRTWKPGKPLGEYRLDEDRFRELKALYDKRNCWTWSYPPMDRATVYECL